MPSRRLTWLALVSAVSAFETDISPVLLPLSPIFSSISPRANPPPVRMTSRSCSRLLPLRLVEARRVLVGIARWQAAHCPTRRAVVQTYTIALRLHRGEAVYEETA